MGADIPSGSAISRFEDIQIDWKNAPILADKGLLQRNLQFMKLLFETGSATDFTEEGKYYGGTCPSAYEVDGIKISFLPHWAHYQCGDFYFPPPNSQGELREQIGAVKAFLSDPTNSTVLEGLERILSIYKGFFKTKILKEQEGEPHLVGVIKNVRTALRDGVFTGGVSDETRRQATDWDYVIRT